MKTQSNYRAGLIAKRWILMVDNFTHFFVFLKQILERNFAWKRVQLIANAEEALEKTSLAIMLSPCLLFFLMLKLDVEIKSFR